MAATEILIKIRKIIRSINLESKKIEKVYGVSIPQLLCLGFLHGSKGYQATQREIRKFLNLNSSTVSGIIYRLEKKAYIAKLPRSGDKRVVTIILTASGKELFQQTPPLLHHRLSEKLSQLEPEKFHAIEDGLDQLINLLEIQELEASPMIVPDENLEEDENGKIMDNQK